MESFSETLLRTLLTLTPLFRYYAYRATGDAKYRDMSWKIFQNIVKWTKAGSAYAELDNVNARMKVGSTDGRRDRMNSYMLTEVFMYAYIIHLDVSLLPLEILSP
jgi:mannosyl-oligosaccharide alpha-1,2-mannosidase